MAIKNRKKTVLKFTLKILYIFLKIQRQADSEYSPIFHCPIPTKYRPNISERPHNTKEEYRIKDSHSINETNKYFRLKTDQIPCLFYRQKQIYHLISRYCLTISNNCPEVPHMYFLR